MRSYLLFISLLAFFTLSCRPNQGQSKSNLLIDKNENAIPYNLSLPDATWWLPHELQEISGIELISDNIIACVQDEKGVVYYFDLLSKKINSKLYFEKNGDFEDLALSENKIWVLKSNGYLYHILKHEPHSGAREIKTGLDKELDFEGLTFLPGTSNLILGPKQNTFLYVFNTDSLAIIDSIKCNHKEKLKASGVAVHPLTNNIYILSSVHKSITILSNDYTFLSTINLDAKKFKQPEGICFAKDGTLFISNEGKKGKANILRFNQQHAKKN